MGLLELDAKTLQVGSTILVFVFALVMLLVWRLYPSVPGVRYWGLTGLPGIGLVVTFMARDATPGLANILFTNLMIFLVPGLIWCGCRAYAGQTLALGRFLLPMMGAALGVIASLVVFEAQEWIRLSLQGIVVGALYASTALTILPRSELRRPAVVFFIGVVSVHALFLLIARPILMHRAVQDAGALVIPPLVMLEAMVFFSLTIIALIMLVMEYVNSQLQVLAEHDGLTHAFNRRTFHQLLGKSRANALRQGESLAVIAMDLDHFKRINDRFGHQCGDEVLRSFVRFAQSKLRLPDIMGRVGGEEFAFCLPKTTLAQAETVAERLRQVCEEQVVTWEGQEVRCTVSAGLTLLTGSEGVDALMNRADQAMYEAKDRGRNRVVVKLEDSRTTASAPSQVPA